MQTSKHLQIQGRSAKLIFILQMHRNIVSLNKRFGRQCFKTQTEIKSENVTCNQPIDQLNVDKKALTVTLNLII